MKKRNGTDWVEISFNYLVPPLVPLISCGYLGLKLLSDPSGLSVAVQKRDLIELQIVVLLNFVFSALWAIGVLTYKVNKVIAERDSIAHIQVEGGYDELAAEVRRSNKVRIASRSAPIGSGSRGEKWPDAKISGLKDPRTKFQYLFNIDDPEREKNLMKCTELTNAPDPAVWLRAHQSELKYTTTAGEFNLIIFDERLAVLVHEQHREKEDCFVWLSDKKSVDAHIKVFDELWNSGTPWSPSHLSNALPAPQNQAPAVHASDPPDANPAGISYTLDEI